MIEANHPRGRGGSPSSSETVNSAQNTPETKLTAFSPEEIRSGYKASKSGIVRPNVPPAFSLNVHPKASPSGKTGNTLNFVSADPFVGSSNATLNSGRGFSGGPKLSPIASSFTPQGSFESLFRSSNRQNFGLPASTSNHLVGSSGTDFSDPASSFITFTKDFATHEEHATSSNATPRQSQSSSGASSKAFAKLGQFSSDVGSSRYLYIGNVPGKTPMIEIEQFFHRDVFPSMKHLGINEVVLTGSVYVSFGDIRDSLGAYKKVTESRSGWKVEFIATVEYFTRQNMALPALVFEAQVLVKACYGGPIEQFDCNGIGIVVKELLENYGGVMAMDTVEGPPPIASFRVEFHNSNTTHAVLHALQGFKIAACTLSVQPYFNGHPPAEYADTQRPLIIGQDDGNLGNTFDNMSLNSPTSGYEQGVFTSPGFQRSYGHNMVSQPLWASSATPQASAGRSFASHRDFHSHQMPSPLVIQKSGFNAPDLGESSPWSPYYGPYHDFGMQSPIWSPYPPGAIGQERATPMMSPYRPGFYPYHQRFHSKLMGHQTEFPSGHHNIVDVERIRQGLDVRTTIMLRNIPNKIDQAMLKDIVDETSRGKYDFMYLRIDFANNCNVGYAFINFEDPYHIIDFMNARAGNRWNRFNSEKVAEVSYATIQGRDCLVQKFRNSSVMLEHPSFRPKIFHTNGSLAGTEDNFPGPDNPSKMRRSVENAEHVGLFAPRAGQNFRDEQRRRRSQYDRGTRLAEMEDAYDIDRHDYRGDASPYQQGPALRYRRSSPYLPTFEEY